MRNKDLPCRFSDQPFDQDVELTWISPEQASHALGQPASSLPATGNWYTGTVAGEKMVAWLCPALYEYFETPPQRIFVKAEKLPAGSRPHLARRQQRSRGTAIYVGRVGCTLIHRQGRVERRRSLRGDRHRRRSRAQSVSHSATMAMNQTITLKIAMVQNQTLWTYCQFRSGPHSDNSHSGRAGMTHEIGDPAARSKPAAVSTTHHPATAAALTFRSNSSFMANSFSRFGPGNLMATADRAIESQTPLEKAVSSLTGCSAVRSDPAGNSRRNAPSRRMAETRTPRLRRSWSRRLGCRSAGGPKKLTCLATSSRCI